MLGLRSRQLSGVGFCQVSPILSSLSCSQHCQFKKKKKAIHYFIPVPGCRLRSPCPILSSLPISPNAPTRMKRSGGVRRANCTPSYI